MVRHDVVGRAGQVRRQQQPGRAQQPTVPGQRFDREDIQGRAGEPTGVQGLAEGVLVDDAPASGVQQVRRRPQPGQQGGVHQPAGRRQPWTVQRQHVGGGHQLLERQ